MRFAFHCFTLNLGNATLRLVPVKSIIGIIAVYEGILVDERQLNILKLGEYISDLRY
jgi:hypothetical protein